MHYDYKVARAKNVVTCLPIRETSNLTKQENIDYAGTEILEENLSKIIAGSKIKSHLVATKENSPGFSRMFVMLNLLWFACFAA